VGTPKEPTLPHQRQYYCFCSKIEKRRGWLILKTNINIRDITCLMEQFEKIKQAYKELHDEFLKKNPVLTKHFKEGVWAPSIPKEVFKIFHKYADKNKTFLDLGSGDGIVVMIASLFFKKAYGIEINKEFFDISVRMKDKLSIENVEFRHGNLFDINIGDYDVMFIAPDKEFGLKFENKIEKELKGKLVVYSSIFKPRVLEYSDHFETSHFDVYVYENIPKKV
jgi:hypothetical protein